MLKRLAAFLGFLCLVLLLLAFEDRQVESGVEIVRARMAPTVDRLREVAVRPAPAKPAAGPIVIVGEFRPVNPDAPGGAVGFRGAVLSFAEAPALRTRPYRVAYGREPLARDLGLPAAHQIELRQVVPMDARTPVAASPLCDGAVPGWVGLARAAGRLEMLVWSAGPAPDAPGAVLCRRLRFDG